MRLKLINVGLSLLKKVSNMVDIINDSGSDAKEGMYPDDYWADMAYLGILHPDLEEHIEKEKKSIEKFERRCKARAAQYNFNNNVAKTGSKIRCAFCFKETTKTHYQKKFCCTKCKDRYHNSVNEDRRNRTEFNLRLKAGKK